MTFTFRRLRIYAKEVFGDSYCDVISSSLNCAWRELGWVGNAPHWLRLTDGRPQIKRTAYTPLHISSLLICLARIVIPAGSVLPRSRTRRQCVSMISRQLSTATSSYILRANDMVSEFDTDQIPAHLLLPPGVAFHLCRKRFVRLQGFS
jgi:hypothetical protein